jgi:hypothetical protein
MNVSPQIEPTSTNRLLTCLGLAIDEAKLVRSIIESKDLAHKLKNGKPLSEKLRRLNREIEYLEVKLAKVKSRANKS